MARTTRVISISLPEKLEIEEMAREEGISRSELVRQMARSYRRERRKDELTRLQSIFAPKMRAAGILTEEDVDRLVFEDR
jgi:metal-responsive CopG/Arc/MetJ family transcriptional regulator